MRLRSVLENSSVSENFCAFSNGVLPPLARNVVVRDRQARP
jgi:hypothetical protein